MATVSKETKVISGIFNFVWTHERYGTNNFNFFKILTESRPRSRDSTYGDAYTERGVNCSESFKILSTLQPLPLPLKAQPLFLVCQFFLNFVFLVGVA